MSSVLTRIDDFLSSHESFTSADLESLQIDEKKKDLRLKDFATVQITLKARLKRSKFAAPRDKYTYFKSCKSRISLCRRRISSSVSVWSLR